MIGNRAFTALIVGWLLTSAVQAKLRPADIAGVYPSAGPGDRKLYAIARVNPGAGPAKTRAGESIIQVFVTGRDRRVEGTASRPQSQSLFGNPRWISLISSCSHEIDSTAGWGSGTYLPCETGGGFPLSLASHDSGSVLAVNGPPIAFTDCQLHCLVMPLTTDLV